MRDRHFPRLCRSCDAPMARQEDSCWSCEAAWDYRRSARRNDQRVVPGGHAARPASGNHPPGAAVIGEAPGAAQTRFGRGTPGRGRRRVGAQGSRRKIPAVQ